MYFEASGEGPGKTEVGHERVWQNVSDRDCRSGKRRDTEENKGGKAR